MPSEFRAQTLGDLFRPITKTYASLIAYLINPDVTDNSRANILFRELARIETARSYERFMKQSRIGHIELFGQRVLVQIGNLSFSQIASGYFREFAGEFNLGRLFAGVKFSYFSKLHREPRVRMFGVKISTKRPSSRALREQVDAISAGAFFDRLSKTKTYNKVTTIMAQHFFDTGATLLARLTQTNIFFDVASLFLTIDFKEWQLPVEFDIYFDSNKIHVVTSVKEIRGQITPDPRIVQKMIEEYLEKVTVIREIMKFLKRFPPKMFEVHIRYVTSGKRKGGTLISFCNFAPTVSRFDTILCDPSVKSIEIQWLKNQFESIGNAVRRRHKKILSELGPDSILRHLQDKIGVFRPEEQE